MNGANARKDSLGAYGHGHDDIPHGDGNALERDDTAIRVSKKNRQQVAMNMPGEQPKYSHRSRLSSNLAVEISA